jgi:hypothetical protein
MQKVIEMKDEKKKCFTTEDGRSGVLEELDAFARKSGEIISRQIFRITERLTKEHNLCSHDACIMNMTGTLGAAVAHYTYDNIRTTLIKQMGQERFKVASDINIKTIKPPQPRVILAIPMPLQNENGENNHN